MFLHPIQSSYSQLYNVHTLLINCLTLLPNQDIRKIINEQVCHQNLLIAPQLYCLVLAAKSKPFPDNRESFLCSNTTSRPFLSAIFTSEFNSW